jgi:integral membrane sensor domain MASE1
MSITLTFALGNTIAAFIASVKLRETLTSRFAQEKRSITLAVFRTIANDVRFVLSAPTDPGLPYQ